MNHNVNPDLENLLVPIEQLETLPNNPRKGNISAIAASYKEFGQVKPIVAVDNQDGTGTVIAGNHQLAAAKQLGWTHIAVLHVPFDHDKAIAFALADNRTSELGEDNQELLHDMLISVVEDMPEFFEELGWDDFEIASISTPTAGASSVVESNDGWTAPTLIQPPPTEANEETMRSLVTQGATATDSAGAKTVVQYTLVFNDAKQQAVWYSFLRYLKADATYSGLATTSEQIMAFLNRHVSLDDSTSTE
tara:strand:- start:1510 stop:2256 length:747 start_codon:yes stop_codon:yes gene_type:complete